MGHNWPLKWDVLVVRANWIHSYVLTDVHENFWQKLCRKSISPKSPWTIAHENRQNRGVYLLCSTFDLQNGTFWPRGLTGCIAKVLTVVHEKFWLKLFRKSRSPKSSWTIPHENRQYWGFSALGNVWPLKWDVLSMSANRLHSQGLNGRPRKILAKIISKFKITKKSMDYST